MIILRNKILKIKASQFHEVIFTSTIFFLALLAVNWNGLGTRGRKRGVDRHLFSGLITHKTFAAFDEAVLIILLLLCTWL